MGKDCMLCFWLSSLERPSCKCARGHQDTFSGSCSGWESGMDWASFGHCQASDLFSLGSTRLCLCAFSSIVSLDLIIFSICSRNNSEVVFCFPLQYCCLSALLLWSFSLSSCVFAYHFILWSNFLSSFKIPDIVVIFLVRLYLVYSLIFYNSSLHLLRAFFFNDLLFLQSQI